MTALLVPLVVVTLIGVVMFRSSIGALESFRRDTIDETARVNKASELVALADDVGEQYVEAGRRRRRDTVSFDQSRPRSHPRWALQDELGADRSPLWTRFGRDGRRSSRSSTRRRPSRRDDRTDSLLDAFHDDLDEALSLLADLNTLNGVDVADEIASMRQTEQQQLVVGLATFLVGLAIASLLVRWVRRSITARLALLESAAVRFGSDDLSHRVDVWGDDELGPRR